MTGIEASWRRKEPASSIQMRIPKSTTEKPKRSSIDQMEQRTPEQRALIEANQKFGRLFFAQFGIQEQLENFSKRLGHDNPRIELVAQSLRIPQQYVGRQFTLDIDAYYAYLSLPVTRDGRELTLATGFYQNPPQDALHAFDGIYFASSFNGLPSRVMTHTGELNRARSGYQPIPASTSFEDPIKQLEERKQVIKTAEFQEEFTQWFERGLNYTTRLFHSSDTVLGLSARTR